MFRFEDIVRLSPGYFENHQRSGPGRLGYRNEECFSELKKAIYTTMSKRAVEALEEQLGFLGPKALEIESAQIELSKSFANLRRMRRSSWIRR